MMNAGTPLPFPLLEEGPHNTGKIPEREAYLDVRLQDLVARNFEKDAPFYLANVRNLSYLLSL